MSIRDILLVADAGAAFPARLDAAFVLARRHEARLTCLFVVDVGVMPAGSMAMVDMQDTRGIEIWQNQLVAEGHRMGDRLATMVSDHAKAVGIATDLNVIEGSTVPAILWRARHSDLVVLGQPHPSDPAALSVAVAEAVLLGCGRPVFLVPHIGCSPTTGHRILACWDGSREASRALHDAIPLMRRASQVTVLQIDPPHDGACPAETMAAHLERHGVPATAAEAESAGLDVADVVLNQAADRSADLIVAGGYGHSRLVEIVLGGVTRDLLRHMTVPVLMSH